MRKVSLLLMVALFTTHVFAISFPPKNQPSASAVMIPLLNSGQQVSLAEFVTFTPKRYKELTGQSLSFSQRLELKTAKWKLKKAVNSDGTVNTKKFKRAWGEGGFHFGGFALGLLLGPLGVLITYFVNDDYNQERRRSAWLGLSSFLAVILLSAALLV